MSASTNHALWKDVLGRELRIQLQHPSKVYAKSCPKCTPPTTEQPLQNLIPVGRVVISSNFPCCEKKIDDAEEAKCEKCNGKVTVFSYRVCKCGCKPLQ